MLHIYLRLFTVQVGRSAIGAFERFGHSSDSGTDLIYSSCHHSLSTLAGCYELLWAEQGFLMVSRSPYVQSQMCVSFNLTIRDR